VVPGEGKTGTEHACDADVAREHGHGFNLLVFGSSPSPTGDVRSQHRVEHDLIPTGFVVKVQSPKFDFRDHQPAPVIV
jgi:hypothetical protein